MHNRQSFFRQFFNSTVSSNFFTAKVFYYTVYMSCADFLFLYINKYINNYCNFLAWYNYNYFYFIKKTCLNGLIQQRPDPQVKTKNGVVSRLDPESL